MLPQPTILVAEADRAIADVIVEALCDEGYDASSVDQGADAVAVSMAVVPDLVLLDMDLIDRSGLDVLKMLQQYVPAMPIVFLTVDTERAERFAAQGVAHLFMPFELDALYVCVATHVRRAGSSTDSR